MKYFKFLFSGWFMGVLLLVFAYVIGYATFVENDYGATAAKLAVYNTTWFEVLLLLMIINFTGMIFTKHLYLKSKINILIVHLALVVIIIGAGITRYYGFEGQMHIRNGQTTNIFRSSDTYMFVQLQQGEQQENYEEKIFLAPAPAREVLLQKEYSWQGKPLTITAGNYYPQAKQVLVPADTGDPFITLVVGGQDGRHQFSLRQGETRRTHDFAISFEDTTRRDALQIMARNGELLMRFPQRMRVAVEGGDDHPPYEIEGFVPIKIMSVHTVGNTSFVVKEFIEHGKVEYQPVTNENEQGVPILELTVNDQQAVVQLGKPHTFTTGAGEVTVKVGYKMLELPFALKLIKFELERYPGSNSPSSYASEVVLIDQANNIEMPYRIYMNHILNYGGYRFFQSSYDQDERGTILSVNHDFWGTLVTYIGYFSLFASLIVTFFTRKTRFARVAMQLKEIHEKRKKLLAPALWLLAILFAGPAAQAQDVSARHAAKFGKLYLQNKEGRIEPVNTMANKILVKISKESSYHNLTADQVFLGMITDHEKWQREPIIKVPETAVQNLLGIRSDYATFMDFIDANGQYKIRAQVEQAYIKKPALRSTYDKALINVDERVNVCYMVLNGSLLRIFPVKDHPNNKWVTPPEHHQAMGHGTEYGDLFDNYVAALKEAVKTNNYQEAEAKLALISKFQQDFGGEILPSATKANLEILYNKTNIFKNLFPVYLTIGVILVGFFFLSIFKPSWEFKKTTRAFLAVLVLAFSVQTIGLAIRWYISGHAPWSNGYESMIYISWATMLAGFMFMKKSSITLGVTSVLAGITLLTAHMSWLNPELTNLVPVLKSYWLTIHVATITASYGFLALGCMIAFLNLCILIFRNKQNQLQVDLTLKELTLIVEMTLSVGLVLLIIGNFLGGIWANESWGRYWGWDPKETWTLVTVILYTFTLHLTLIPSFRDTFTFNFFAFISFGAVLMTYFGVNYYLSGLHSYASGDPVQVPSFVYYSLVVIGIVSVLAAYNEFNYKKQLEAEEARE